MTAVILMIILFYGLDKFISLIEKENPFVSRIEIPEFFSLSYEKNLTKLGSKIAFTLEEYFTHEAKLDPRYIKTIVRLDGKKEGKFFEKMLDFHKCSEDELEKFHEIEPKSKFTVDEIVESN